MTRREIRAVIGPNGAGKTTFFNALSGVVRPSAGKILFEGMDITGLSPRHTARLRLVRTFQVTSLFAGLSVRDNIWVSAQARRGILSAVWRKKVRAEISDKTDEVIELLGLGSVAERLVADLSYGDQRVVEVAIALALQPKLLLLDEPTAGMSPEETRSMQRLIAGLPKALTLLLIEHDMDVVFEMAERITVLDYGRVLIQGPPATIRGSAVVKQIYFGEVA
jgi:branched-chain amino acid transport system ATP-binding protein